MHSVNLISYFLTRAVCGRIEQTIQGLPPPYRLNQPRMNQGSSTESRQPQKAPTISVNWDCGKSLTHCSLFVFVDTFGDIKFLFLFVCWFESLLFDHLPFQSKHQAMLLMLLTGFIVSILQKRVSSKYSMP